MIVRQFEPGDLAAIAPQPGQMAARDVSRETAVKLRDAGPGFTACQDGLILLVAGFYPIHAGHARCWCVLAELDGFALADLTRRTRDVLAAAQADYARIDMEVETAFAPGHRWARLLGFTREGTMRAYGPDGQDFDLYARVKGQVDG